MGIGWKIIKMIGIYEATLGLKENNERLKLYKYARQYCDEVNKPLLVIGIQRHFWEPPNGDVTIDADPLVNDIEGGVWADEREIPFADKYFGAVYNAHTLEHLPTVYDVELAVSESVRVADKVFFLCPSAYGIYSTLFCPAHKLRIWFDQINNEIRVEPNKFNTGLGPQPGAGDTTHPPPTKGGYSQSLVTTTMPIVFKLGNSYLIES